MIEIQNGFMQVMTLYSIVGGYNDFRGA